MSGLQLRGVTVAYGRGGSAVHAVEEVDLEVPRGAIVGLVGESGCGKSSLARAVCGLVPVAAGTVLLDGEDLAAGPGCGAACRWCSRTRTRRSTRE